MKICTVERSFKNTRYRILFSDDNYYLLDMNQSYWSIFFPFLFWIFPNKVYKISSEIAESLRVPTKLLEGIDKKYNLITVLSFISMGIFPIIGRWMSDNIIDFFNINSSTNINIFILVLLFIFCITLNLYLNNLLKKKINLNYDKLDFYTIYLKPISFKNEVKTTLLHIFIILMLVMMSGGYILTGNLFILFTGFILFYMFLSWNKINLSKDNKCYIKSIK